MNVTCPECSSVFRVDPAKIPLAGVRARCSVCGGVIAIGERGRIDEDFTASTPAPHTPARQRPPVASALPPRPPVTMPTPPQPMHAGFAAQGGAAVQPPPLRTSAPTSMPSRPSAVTPPQDRVVVPPPAPARTTPPRPSAAPPQATAPVLPRMSPFSPAPAPAPAHAPAPSPAPAAASPPVSPPQTAPPRPTAPVARPPINPFLANDPNQKAKRLARALVSDIIAYFPDRHQQAKRDGVLREAFREEIKKSYEEYVEQMGKEFAENTTHFQDALNDVLAGGARIF